MDYLNYIILGFIIYYSAIFPIKGVKQISTSDLKNELQDKTNNLLMFEHLESSKQEIFAVL